MSPVPLPTTAVRTRSLCAFQAGFGGSCCHLSYKLGVCYWVKLTGFRWYERYFCRNPRVNFWPKVVCSVSLAMTAGRKPACVAANGHIITVSFSENSTYFVAFVGKSCHTNEINGWTGAVCRCSCP